MNLATQIRTRIEKLPEGKTFGYADLRMVIEAANENIENGGGPFWALVARNGKIVGRSSNKGGYWKVIK
ncbi:MAG: hypothetical protein WCR12_08500 [Dysgonamonadaceae bacterium]